MTRFHCVTALVLLIGLVGCAASEGDKSLEGIDGDGEEFNLASAEQCEAVGERLTECGLGSDDEAGVVGDDAIANVLSSRSRYSRCPPSSTIAMAPPGALSFFASATAPAASTLAPSSVNAGFCTTCVCARAPAGSTITPASRTPSIVNLPVMSSSPLSR